LNKAFDLIEEHEKRLRERRKATRDDVQAACDALLAVGSAFEHWSDSDLGRLAKAVNGLKAQVKGAKLNLRIKGNPEVPEDPVVKLGDVEKRTLTVTTVARTPKRLVLVRWPKFEVELAGSGQGSNLTPEIGERGGQARAASMTRREQLALAKAGLEARNEPKK